MIEVFKEFWYRRKILVYRKLIEKCANLRRKLREKQKHYNEKVDVYTKLHKEQLEKN